LKAFFADEPDQALVRARASSERLVATVRLAIIALIVTFSIVSSLGKPRLLMLALPPGLVALAYGYLLLWMAKRVSAPWFPWFVSSIDVTVSSVGMAAFLFVNQPLAIVNNHVLFETYFVAIAISALRYDWRLCAFTTVVAMLEFGGLVAYVALHWDLRSLRSEALGAFLPAQLITRMLVLAGHGGATVAVAQWARHLRLMIGTDHLTGLLQRRPFLERIGEELSRADRMRTVLSVAILDVDEFKRFNDEHGHLEGDRALQALADQLRRSVRTTDLVARYGGEEFVIAFPRLDVQLATRRVELVRAEVELAGPTTSVGALTVSAGVASWPADGEDFEAVLRAADQRLYQAKRSGRNIVVGPVPTPIRNVDTA
jgi:diguanylate cyclase (GGDEF)-like protein